MLPPPSGQHAESQANRIFITTPQPSLEAQGNRQQQQQEHRTSHSFPTSNPAPHYHHQHHGLALPKKSHSTGSITSSTAERAIFSRPITAPRSPLQDLGGYAAFQRSVRHPNGSPPLTPPNSTPGSSLGELVNGSRHATSAAVDIPQVKKATKVINGFTISISVGQNNPLETPPSTPDVASGSSGLAQWVSQDLTFLKEVFPTAARAIPYAKSVEITQEGTTWEAFVLELPGKPKTLIVALLDLADEHLGCSAFVIALEKQSPALAGLIHSLMYVSGQVVTRPPFEVDPKWVLVGMEI
ncbi:hypothetical protein FRC01_000666 [Tulasnella sp. 417]|nr:hypothetical protein FRC01_000666 [Tulasnella sp. 417]